MINYDIKDDKVARAALRIEEAKSEREDALEVERMRQENMRKDRSARIADYNAILATLLSKNMPIDAADKLAAKRAGLED